MEEDGPGVYDPAAVCERGHLITGNIRQAPEGGDRFCSRCGAVVLTKCATCQQPIRGDFRDYYNHHIARTPPAWCHSCGTAFPWTAGKLDAARELTEEIDELTPLDKDKVKTAIDDVLREGPRNEIGATRLKKILGSAKSAGGKALYTIIVEVASEAAKKILVGS